jgi:NitT/TauT family transport system substrate-binding protein
MRNSFWRHTSITLKEMCAGFSLALAFAFPLAWAMMRFRSSRSLLQPLFIVIQCIPMFTLAPIMVFWFGWSYTAIVIPTALMILFPLTLNIYQGLRSTPEDLLEFFQTNQATAWQIFFKLRLPWAIPHIFAGFRISSAIAGVSAVAGEWAGAQQGLGILMLESRRNTDLEITFGALICLTGISTLLYGFILYCEKISLPPRHWKFPFKKLAKQKVKKGNKRFALTLFLLCCLSGLLFGCRSGEEKKKTRLLLDWLPNPNHVPIYVGLEKGYFREEGIDLSIQKMHEGGEGISYLVSGKADLLINHMPGTLKACARGAKLKMVALLIKEPLRGLIYRADLSIDKMSDLSGKVFGYCIGVPDLAFLNFLLEQGHIHPKKMKNVSVDLVFAMGTGSVDFIYGGFWNIEPAQLRALGVETKTFKIQDLGFPHYYEMILLANANSQQATPEFVAHLQRAVQKSLNFCKAYPEEAFACFLLHNPDRLQKTIAWQREAWALTFPLLADDQAIDAEIIKDFYAWQLSRGVIKQHFDFQELITIR